VRTSLSPGKSLDLHVVRGNWTTPFEMCLGPMCPQSLHRLVLSQKFEWRAAANGSSGISPGFCTFIDHKPLHLWCNIVPIKTRSPKPHAGPQVAPRVEDYRS